MKLFINNVPNLMVRAIIASQLTSMLCLKSVFAMDPYIVTKIASESEDMKLQRQKISENLKALKADNTLQTVCSSCDFWSVTVRFYPFINSFTHKYSPSITRSADNQAEKTIIRSVIESVVDCRKLGRRNLRR